jgi:hypothetical protein
MQTLSLSAIGKEARYKNAGRFSYVFNKTYCSKCNCLHLLRCFHLGTEAELCFSPSHYHLPILQDAIVLSTLLHAHEVKEIPSDKHTKHVWNVSTQIMLVLLKTSLFYALGNNVLMCRHFSVSSMWIPSLIFFFKFLIQSRWRLVVICEVEKWIIWGANLTSISVQKYRDLNFILYLDHMSKEYWDLWQSRSLPSISLHK